MITRPFSPLAPLVLNKELRPVVHAEQELLVQ